MQFPTKQDIIEAAQRIKPYINRTPILTSSYLNQLSGVQLFFKAENMQKAGSFKARGASNKILQLDNPKTLCTWSSGNHAQGVSYVAQRLGLKAYIVMPSEAPEVKKKAVRHYNAEIVECGPAKKDMEEMCKKVAIQKQAEFVHAYDDVKIIAGAGTCAMEIFEEVEKLDYLLVPIGGGGFSSGTVLGTHYFSPDTKVIGVQPFLAGDAKDSMEKGSIQPEYPPVTLAEGVRVNLGVINFAVLKEYLSDVILVSEVEMIEAAQLLMERMKTVVEISGATVLAAALKDPRFKGKRVAAILSGGNMDLSHFFKFMHAKLEKK